MPERAHLTSVEALESFRAALVIYLSKAQPALEEVTAQLMRTRVWIGEDRQRHWQQQRRQRMLQLEQTRNTLSTVRMSNVHGATHEAQVDYRRAQQAYEEAESKLRTLKRWGREFDSCVGTQAKQLDRLMDQFITRLPQAIAYLDQLLDTLDQYKSVPSVAASAVSTSSPDPVAPAQGDVESPGDAPGAADSRKHSPSSGGAA